MTENTQDLPRCLYCERLHDEVPLVAITYKSKDYWICPQHLPLLIHQPHLLAGKLPDLNLDAAEHHDH